MKSILRKLKLSYLLRRSLERGGQPIALSGKALEILAVLLERRGEVVDKNDLMRQVWPDTAVEENNITVAISALRKALGETPPTGKWIVTDTRPRLQFRWPGRVSTPSLRCHSAVQRPESGWQERVPGPWTGRRCNHAPG